MGFITLQSHHRPVTILSYGASATTAATNSRNPYRHTSPVCRQFLPALLYLWRQFAVDDGEAFGSGGV